MNFIIRKARNYPMSAFLVVAIWIVCMIPVPETPLSDVEFFDKWTHFVMYGTLTLCIWFERFFYREKDCEPSKPRNSEPVWLIGFVLPVIMGGLIELVQPFVGRSGDWFDFICNSIGVVLGCIIASIIRRFVGRAQYFKGLDIDVS